MMSAIPKPQANPRKTTSVRKLGSVDIGALLVAVQSIPESIWDAGRFQPVNATACRYRSIGVSKPSVLRGRSFSFLATSLSLA